MVTLHIAQRLWNDAHYKTSSQLLDITTRLHLANTNQIGGVLQKKKGHHVLNSYYLLIICFAFLVGGRSL